MLITPVQLGQSPEGFYIATSEEIYEGLIEPEFMTLKELDKAIEEGLTEWTKMHREKSGWFSKWMPVIAAIAVGGVAVAMVAAPAAAAGAATAATQVGATAATTGTAFPPITAAGAISATQKAATVVRMGGMIHKVATGKNDADRLIQAADVIATSPTVTDAASKIFEQELAKRGEKIQTEQAKKALRARIEREQELYAEYMRRQAYRLQQEITADVVPPTLPEKRPAADWATVAMAATPFILLMIGRS